MTKIAIVTMSGNYNFGNRLQNLALQEALKYLGAITVETLRHEPTGETGLDRLRSQWHARRMALREAGPKALGSSIMGRLLDRHGPDAGLGNAENERRDAIAAFSKEFIKETDLSPFLESVRHERFDLGIVGSDQVWSPGFAATNDLAFLRFLPESRRIAYAASFGVSSIPRHLASRYREGISGIPRVSVREERGADLVYQLTRRHVPVVLDPTMLLESRKWGTLAQVPLSLPPEGYVLKFFLGTGGEERMTSLREFAGSNGWVIIDLQDQSQPDLYALSPLQFVGAIKEASLVVTDSFHAAVFSSIFKVPCLVRTRAGMRSRLDTLASKLGIAWVEGHTGRQIELAMDVDWTTVHERIAVERRNSLEFLRSAVAES